MSARFRFSLERLLQLRQRAARDAAVQTAQAQSQLAEAETARDATASCCDAARAQMQPAVNTQAQVSALRQAAVLRDSLQRHLELSQEAVATASHELRQRIAQLNASTRDSRVLERLEDRQREVWQVEVTRVEQQTMDGVARARFLRARDRQDHTDPAS